MRAGVTAALLHVHAGGEARVPAFLDDYAFLIKGLIALYEAAFDPGRLETALSLTGRAIELFGDEGEEVLLRRRPGGRLPAQRGL
ncbi:MAG: hypothetical protein M0C28_14970 [Candidatus Moduliflexus flocculans]|nr:hypothetical protein [Candidatus Moduliflexus flocculans]